MILLIMYVLQIGGAFAEIIKGPEGGTYTNGTDILLTCIVGESNDHIIWRDVTRGIKIFIGKDKNTKMQQFGNFEISSLQGNYSLIIKRASISDEGTYSCQERDQKMNAAITIEVKPTLALYINGTSTNITMDQHTATVGDTITVTCTAKNSRPNVSLELKFGKRAWTKPTLSNQLQNVEYFDTSVIQRHVVSKSDSPVLCRVLGLFKDQQAEVTINILYKPNCGIIRSGDNVECICKANPPVYEYTMFVNGESRSTNESLSLSNYAPANFSCSGVNTIGTGYSSSHFISNASAVGIILIVFGILVCCPLVVYLIIRRYRKRRGKRIQLNMYTSSLTTARTPDVEDENTYCASDSNTNTVIDDSGGIYAHVYANAPKEKFVTLNDIRFEKQLGESKNLERWIGRLHSAREVIISSPRANTSPMTQINWVAFVKNLLDLPKTAYILHVEGICIEMGRFYLLQVYATGTLREKLVSIMYKSLKRNVEITSTSTVLLELASSLVHGIEFIQRQRFYHPGLSSDEVMVSNDTTCKLYNFCTADLVQDRIDDVIAKREEGVEIRTLPPEAVFKRVYDEASEMWSLSATLWEIFTHGQKAKFNYLKDLSLQDPLGGEYSLKKPLNLDTDIYKIMTKCWSKQPNRRPKISQLKFKIDEKIIPRNQEMDIEEWDTLQDYELMTVGATIN